MHSISQMWKRGFDFRGRSTRQEFICPFAVNAAIAVEVLFTVLTIPDSVIFWYIALFGSIYLILSVLPLSALIVRRLRDTGKGAAWCLLIFLPVIGEIVLAVILLGGTLNFSPVSNDSYSVYGPAPADYYATDEKDFRPEENTEPAVYGPPPDEMTTLASYDFGSDLDEDPEDTSDSETASDLTDEFDPEDNVSPTVYGPPSDEYTVGTEAMTTIDETPVFLPEDNLPALVYGPPEYFE